MANLNGYVSGTDVMGVGAQQIGDPSMNIVGRPRYRQFLQDGIELMSMEVGWDKRYQDGPVPASRQVQMPAYCSGLSAIWLYSGDCSNIQQTQRVIQKPNYVTDGGEGGFENNNWTNYTDATQGTLGWHKPDGLFYCGVQGKTIHLSPSCLQFPRIRIAYLGMGFDKRCQDEEIRVPIWAKAAIQDYISMRAAGYRMFVEGKERLFQDRERRYDGEFKGVQGSWMNAKCIWGAMDQKQMDDSNIYMTGIGGTW